MRHRRRSSLAVYEGYLDAGQIGGPDNADLQQFIVYRETTLREAMQRIDVNGAGIAVVAAPDLKFIDLITDGDIRRALLQGIDLAQPLDRVLAHKAATTSRRPITARIDDPPELILLLMERLGIHQVPLLDSEDRIRRVVHRAALASRPRLEPGHAAVVMAGGFGTRLRPLTDQRPKPMLEVGGRPMLEHIVGRLVQAGIERISLTLHYKPEVIVEHFGDGRAFGAELDYIHETVPLGTAGSVRGAKHGGLPLLVMNGDVVTSLNFASLLDFHKRSGATLTVAAAPYEIGVPYGVIDVDGVDVRALEEKPTKRFFINTGIYVLSPEACELIPADKRFDMTDLIEAILAARQPVKVYAMHEYWRDVGRIEDLQRVNRDFAQGGIC